MFFQIHTDDHMSVYERVLDRSGLIDEGLATPHAIRGFIGLVYFRYGTISDWPVNLGNLSDIADFLQGLRQAVADDNS